MDRGGRRDSQAMQASCVYKHRAEDKPSPWYMLILAAAADL